MQNSNIFTRTITPDPSVRGEGSLFPFSEIVSTLSHCTAVQNWKIHPGTKPRPTDLRFRGRKVLSFSVNVLKLNYNNNAEFKFCPGTILRTPVSGEKNVCFCSPKMKQLSYSNAEFKNSPGDNTLNLRVRGEERLLSFSENVPKLSYIEMLNSNIFPGTIPRTPRFRGEGNLCLFAENVS